jgi:DNA-directed RNA polymerase subunit L
LNLNDLNFAYIMDHNIEKNYALYIQISKSTTSQTIHKNLLEIIQIFCLPFTKQIKDFENSTFKFLELPFHKPLKIK